MINCNLNFEKKKQNENILLIVIFLQTDRHVERGCVKDLKEKYDECLEETESCVFCHTDNCNNAKVERSFGHRVTSTVMLNVSTILFIFLYF